MYEIYLERAAERDLKRLATDEFNQIIRKIKGLAVEPRPSGCRKIIGSKNDWRIRVGHYRVIYEVDDKERVVRVFRVKHRKEVYR